MEDKENLNKKGTKKIVTDQKYEKYWQLTLEFSDFYKSNFNNSLKTIVDFIDKNNTFIDVKNNRLTSDKYEELQNILFDKFNSKKGYPSIRKCINQFLKLGFVNNGLLSYHSKTRDFLNEKDVNFKRVLYSEILYDNASFNRSFKKTTNDNQINFFIKTLENCRKISKENLAGLMCSDFEKFKNRGLDEKELEEVTKQTINNEFVKRKYNQIGYIFNLFQKLDGIVLDDNHNLVFSNDYLDNGNDVNVEQSTNIISSISLSSSVVSVGARKPDYGQRLFKSGLIKETEKLNNGRISCWIEDISYPTLIASHIRPKASFKNDPNKDLEFDSNNGLLLSPNVDSLFDKGWISFDDKGYVIISKNLNSEIREIVKDYKIPDKYLNSQRIFCLSFHRQNVFKDNILKN